VKIQISKMPDGYEAWLRFLCIVRKAHRSFNSQGRGQTHAWPANKNSSYDFTVDSPLVLNRIVALPTLAASAIFPQKNHSSLAFKT
jgi:hypothetical protein